MKRSSYLSPPTLAIFLITPVHAAYAQAASFDATVEAAALFKATLADEKPPERCEYATTWGRDEAGNMPLLLDGPRAPEPAVLPTPQEVLGIDQAQTHGFCDMEEKQRNLAEKIRSVEQGITSDFELRTTDLSFPVFSQDGTHAVYLKTYAFRRWSRTPDGVKETRPSYIAGDAILCSKKNGTWRTYGTKLVFIAE